VLGYGPRFRATVSDHVGELQSCPSQHRTAVYSDGTYCIWFVGWRKYCSSFTMGRHCNVAAPGE